MSYLEELLPKFRKGAKIRFSSWEEGDYICVKDGEVFDEQGRKIFNIGSALTLLDQWEFYKEPEPDWDYIIKNKCLCWFWNEEHLKYINTLNSADENVCFVSNNFIGNNFRWKNCRPVRRDEVTFYEERKDD